MQSYRTMKSQHYRTTIRSRYLSAKSDDSNSIISYGKGGFLNKLKLKRMVSKSMERSSIVTPANKATTSISSEKKIPQKRKRDVIPDDRIDDELGEQVGKDFRSGFVSIIGNPNVGKSTLMNGILGEALCIVSPKPQTTRHRILGVLTTEDHQLVFSDTPGMVAPAYKLQEVMMDSVRGATGDADIIVLVTDVYGEPLIDEKVAQKLELTNKPILVVVNKMDLIASNTTQKQYNLNTKRKPRRKSVSDTEADEVYAASNVNNTLTDDINQMLYNKTSAQMITSPVGEWEFNHPRPLEDLRDIWAKRLPKATFIGVSAANKEGIGELLERIVSHIPLGPKYFTADTLTTRDERFFTTEIIREALFHKYMDEIPYSCEVVIDSFKDKSDNLSVIEASIIVNKSTQKAIIIGKGGSMLKELGMLAREKLEKFLQRNVYLSLFVKVDEDWRQNNDSLQKYGYVEKD